MTEDRGLRMEDGRRWLGLGFWGENKKRISNVEQGMSNDEVEFGVGRGAGFPYCRYLEAEV